MMVHPVYQVKREINFSALLCTLFFVNLQPNLMNNFILPFLLGRLTGLQTRIREECPKAVFVHCNAHRVSLVVQDAICNITFVRDFIGTIKELINFIRDSPQRLAKFKDLQTDSSPALARFCPTRWTVRVKSLKTVRSNYMALIDFFIEIINDPNMTASVTATARGLLDKVESFSFYFYLEVLITIFDRIEVLNTQLQLKDLHINESNALVDSLKNGLKASRNDERFNEVWAGIIEKSKELELEEPNIPRLRKAPRRYDGQASPHEFQIPDYYRKQYYEIIDRTSASLDERFDPNTMKLMNEIENFITEKGPVDGIISFYNISKKDGTHQFDFDRDRLILHRDMLIDIMKQSNQSPKNIQDVVTFLRSNGTHIPQLEELVKLLKIVLTIPVTTCTCERSFSALRRLKTYLRSTLISQRLNNISILHIHQDIADSLDLSPIINEWISRQNIRKSTFEIL